MKNNNINNNNNNNNINDLINQIGQYIKQQNGQQVRYILDIINNTPSILKHQTPHQIEKTCRLNISNPYNSIISNHLTAQYYYVNYDYFNAFQQQYQSATLQYDAMEVDKSAWMLSIIFIIVRNLRVYSYEINQIGNIQQNQQNQISGQNNTINNNNNNNNNLTPISSKNSYLISCETVLKRYLQKMVIDRTEPATSGKKMGVYYIIIQMFKIYFKLNNLKLCSAINRLTTTGLPQLISYPKSHQISYLFYCGRLSLFEEKYTHAIECLEQSYLHCHKNEINNKRKILFYLIPLNCLKQKFPSKILLKNYNLIKQFDLLIESIQHGNISQFSEILNENSLFYIKNGIFLILEKLRIYVFRNLFQKIYRFIHLKQTNSPNQLTLDLLMNSLKCLNYNIDQEELECILANLIYSGAIKGYIAHKRCVVLSKNDPFPKVPIFT